MCAVGRRAGWASDGSRARLRPCALGVQHSASTRSPDPPGGALSGAGWLPRLPFLRFGLLCITTAYVGRGVVLIWQLAQADIPKRELVFSSIALSIGLVYLAAIMVSWPSLRA
jgi:hypothetical protein